MSNLKQKSVDAIIWNLIARYGNQFFNLIISVILARLLTPADYGLIGVVTVFFALALVFMRSGFGAAFIQKKDANETDASTIFFFNIFISIFFYFILWFTAPFIASFYKQDQLVSLIRVASIILVINSLGMMQITKLTKEVNFKKKTFISLASTLIAGIVGIVSALNNFGVWSLVFQQITRSFVNVLGLWLFYNWKPSMVFSLTSLKTMFSFGSWILMSALLRTIFDNIYILIIGKFFPMAELGFYTKAKGYQKLVSTQPTMSISIVSFPVFSKLQDDKQALKNSLKKFMEHTLFFIAPISAVLMVIAYPLFLVTLTEKWLPMVPYFQLLLIVGVFIPIQKFNLKMLNAQGKSNLNFKISLIKNGLRILNIIIMYRFGVIFIIYGEILLSLIALFINGYYTKKFIKYGMFEQLKDMSNIFLISIISVLMGFFIIGFVNNDFLKILIGILITGGTYLILQYCFNRVFFLNNVNLIGSKFKKE